MFGTYNCRDLLRVCVIDHLIGYVVLPVSELLLFIYVGVECVSGMIGKRKHRTDF